MEIEDSSSVKEEKCLPLFFEVDILGLSQI